MINTTHGRRPRIGTEAWALVLLAASTAWPGGMKNASAAYQAGHYEEALRLARPLALQGDPDAQNMIGTLYMLGQGVPAYPAEAVKWFEKAAQRDSRNAQNTLAAMYLDGRGVTKDYAKAAYWYRKAAAKNSVMAWYGLGTIYAKGFGVPVDYKEAAKWYGLAAEGGYNFAQAALGRFYAEGLGVEKDYAEAFKWYELSSRLNGALDPGQGKALQSKMTLQQRDEAERRVEDYLKRHALSGR